MLRTEEVLSLEEEYDKDIEDFCDEDYFRRTYGDDWVEEHERELAEEEE